MQDLWWSHKQIVKKRLGKLRSRRFRQRQRDEQAAALKLKLAKNKNDDSAEDMDIDDDPLGESSAVAVQANESKADRVDAEVKSTHKPKKSVPKWDLTILHDDVKKWVVFGAAKDGYYCSLCRGSKSRSRTHKVWVEEGVGWCTGTVKKVNVDVKDDPWWDVEYDDGDVETCIGDDDE